MAPTCNPAGGARQMGSTLEIKDQAVELAQGGAQASFRADYGEERTNGEPASRSGATLENSELLQSMPEPRSEPLLSTNISPFDPKEPPPSSGSVIEY